ncbi:conserved hypothetical protein (plasmid) [Methylorubrum populi BJ001]|jgi:photosystem II stability/assembly factor-like uncharacterized protein|uniref:Uncharacterized protein n=2 Tax=Methylorubrum populi TaxID=223967 RepID=A0A160PNF3_9HYPH|nr:conserved hypothetical protein [Methylorubrum populi BJ001]MBY0256402.1 hypothetical protein [Methylobacterium sp.]OAH40197.1 hypothetical protein AX289_32190 [Methylorubrum populi]BAU94061.1 hypothetical protein MPPM_5456 [Methylorubrum populi]
MQIHDLDQAAALTVWPRTTPARIARSKDYVTLREALDAAGKAMAAEDVRTWIITEAGDILSPSWIEARVGTPLAGRRPHT